MGISSYPEFSLRALEVCAYQDSQGGQAISERVIVVAIALAIALVVVIGRGPVAVAPVAMRGDRYRNPLPVE